MKRSVWWMFAGFCLLTASEWLLTPIAGAVRGLVYAAVGLAAVAVNGRVRWNGLKDVVRVALAAVLVLGIPEAIRVWAAEHVSGALGTAVLTLVPVMVVLVAAHWSRGDGPDARRSLVPAFVGLGGVLLLIPVDLPLSLAGRVGLAAIVLSAVAVAIASVAIYPLLQRLKLAQAVAIFCLANAVVLVGVGLSEGWRGGIVDGGILISVLIAAIEVVLLVVLLRGMEPVLLAGRFLIVPLLTIVEGYVLLRPELTLRMGVGLFLLAGGAGAMLLKRGTGEDASLSLR